MSYTPTPFIETINGTSMIEVSQESDFGTVVGGAITLTTNTTYFLRGNVSCANRLVISAENVAIVGWDRDKDGLTYSGSGEFITVTDVNFALDNIKLSATNSSSLILRASNFDYGTYNDGRNKVLTVTNCQFRDCYNVWHIEGFDLVDIQNNLVWYIQATTMGCHFKNVSKLQISSCEYVRWFDETLIGTFAFSPSLAYIAGSKVIEAGIFYESIAGSTAHAFDPLEWTAVGYATVSMVELLANGSGNGFGAVNINGSIFHPQQTQNGIDIVTSSTTGFGTIASNTFINVGLTTGEVFLGDSLTPVGGAYSETECLNYDIAVNQGLLDAKTGIVSTATGNTSDTAGGTAKIISLNVAPVLQASVRFTLTTAAVSSRGRVTYIGTKQIYVSLHITLSFQKQDKGTDDYTFSIAKNGTVITASGLTLPDLDDIGGSATLVYGLLVEQNDYFEVFVSSVAGDDMLVTDMVTLIRE